MHETRGNILKRFVADRSGNFAMMFAAGAVTIVVGAGFALDFSRAVSSQASSRDALDAAILATARQLSLGNIAKDDAQAFLKNYLEGTLKKPIGPGEEYRIVDFHVDPVSEKISAGLERDMPLSFISVAGDQNRKIVSNSAALYGFDETEVVMTFDITGSMGGSKIGDLKDAALTGITELLGNGVSTGKIRIALVPYAEGVNAGSLYPAIYPETEDTSGDPPDDDGIDDDDYLAQLPDFCATERKGPGQFKDDDPTKGMVNRDFRLADCPTSPVVPLTHNKSTLDQAVKDLTASGGTGGHIGIQWAWYLVSPKWADYVPAESVASNYGGDVRKFAVIMTDGEFNVAYEGVPKNQSQYNQSQKSMTKARKLCANMKMQGIEVFTIGFALTQKSAKDLMKDCASADTAEMTYHHEAKNGQQLKKVYKDIATSIKQLRLIR